MAKDHSPPPSRLRLDTSPPLREVEDRRQAGGPSSTPERGGGAEQSEAEGGSVGQTSRSRRKPGTTARARGLRWVENDPEGLLWLELKGRKLGGFHFTRQFAIEPYFADFCCRRQKLVVEVDGSQHADSTFDRRRDAFMQSRGYSILRVWSHEVIKHRTAVCNTILAALTGRLSEDVIASDVRFVFAPSTSPESFSRPTD